jgi:transcriptional regulator GlxA family with amidase domain
VADTLKFQFTDSGKKHHARIAPPPSHCKCQVKQFERNTEKKPMNTRLNHIQNWLELAQQANWVTSALAKNCGISVRTLERHFLKNMGKTPKAWLVEQRQSQAIELLRSGCAVKETAVRIGYKHSNNFSREFRKFWGHYPTRKLPLQAGAVGECRNMIANGVSG